MPINLQYTRNGKFHDLTLQELEKNSSEKTIVSLNGHQYVLGGDKEEIEFLILNIKEFSAHQDKNIESFQADLIQLGINEKTLSCPLLQTAQKTEKTSSQIIDPQKKLNIEKTNQLLNHHFAENLPGCNLVIVKEGNIIYDYSRGVADIDTKEKMTINHPQHFGSVSKQFTAMSVLLLVEAKAIDLDQDIHAYLPSLPPFVYNGKEARVSVRDLLTMRSGLAEAGEYTYVAGKIDQDLSIAQKLEPFFKQNELNLAFAPGLDSHYCNTNYYFLAEIVKNVSGMSLKEYAEKNIFMKLGMHNTHFVDPIKSIQEQSIKGYSVNRETGYSKENTTRNTTWGPCGVIGTPKDMALWDANFTDNKLGKANSELIENFTAIPTPKLQHNDEYGMGLFVGRNGNYKIEHHSGGIEGFTTEFMRVTNTINPKDHLAFFLVANSDMDPQHNVPLLVLDIANIWMEETIFQNTKFPEMPNEKEKVTELSKVEKTQSENLKHYTGSYECAVLETAYECFIEEREGKMGLVLKLKEDTTNQGLFFLIPQENSKFLFSAQNEPATEFCFSETGKEFTYSNSRDKVVNLKFSKK